MASRDVTCGTFWQVRGVADIAVGRNFTILLLSNGEVRACGSNSCGQLGVGTAPAGEASEERPSGQVCLSCCWRTSSHRNASISRECALA